MMPCTHRSWREGGTLPPGRWCEMCGARVDRRGSPAELAMQRAKLEERAARKYEATRIELARKTANDR